MDISHITKLLSSLGKNQVTIPIVTNDFLETKADAYYKSILLGDIYENLDEMFVRNTSQYKLSNMVTPNKGKQQCEKNNTETQQIVNKPIVHNLIYILNCIDNPEFSFINDIEKVKQGSISFLCNLSQYISNSNEKKTVKNAFIKDLNSYIELINNNITITFDQEHIQSLLIFTSKYYKKYIALYGINNELINKEFEFDEDEFDEVVVIKQKDENAYYTENIVTTNEFKETFSKNNIAYIKSKDNYKENLKSACVKDLRQIAKSICIDIHDTHTGKLYSKSDLRLLIEAKLDTI